MDSFEDTSNLPERLSHTSRIQALWRARNRILRDTLNSDGISETPEGILGDKIEDAYVIGALNEIFQEGEIRIDANMESVIEHIYASIIILFAFESNVTNYSPYLPLIELLDQIEDQVSSRDVFMVLPLILRHFADVINQWLEIIECHPEMRKSFLGSREHFSGEIVDSEGNFIYDIEPERMMYVFTKIIGTLEGYLENTASDYESSEEKQALQNIKFDLFFNRELPSSQLYKRILDQNLGDRKEAIKSYVALRSEFFRYLMSDVVITPSDIANKLRTLAEKLEAIFNKGTQAAIQSES